ncbi:putative glutathione peroxidase [Synechococcus elongatus PCC 6301]|uniref:Putative glutathione peroxidase n=1 Tax=Synechococcus sp. (strain ATCC 27144 / PCC 6301 / SAUG 1402/1) TaxID=269084 RepID=A0A0H3K8E3_SYNP6|nr:competence protein CoiA family protein [Synechococcus elongatus]BAD79270.1 putative glutathione peroxidase [Synechococcus elongatus PCC 6301]
MPFKAKDQQGSIVLATDFKSVLEIRKNFPKGRLFCPFCQTLMFPRKRQNTSLHFVHTHPCTTVMEHHPESPEHLQGKLEISKYFQEVYKGMIDAQEAFIEIEHPISEAGKNGRIADVAVVFSTGYRIIGECQLAKIEAADIYQRTQDYYSISADVLWFLGGAADTPENRQAAVDLDVFAGTINFTYST